MPPDEKMYKLVCKQEFADIKESLAEIDRKLFKGNGGKPMDVRMAEQGKDINTLKSRWMWIAVTVGGILTYIGGRVILFFMAMFGGKG